MLTKIVDASVSLDELLSRWVEAKRDESQANAKRIAVEQAIIGVVGVKEEGSTTHTTPLGVKLSVEGSLIYKCDIPALQTLCSGLPDDLMPLQTVVKANDSKLKKIRATEPDIWRKIAAAIETKPSKPAVKVL